MIVAIAVVRAVIYSAVTNVPVLFTLPAGMLDNYDTLFLIFT